MAKTGGSGTEGGFWTPQRRALSGLAAGLAATSVALALRAVRRPPPTTTLAPVLVSPDTVLLHDGRGRRADRPTEIPARGWKDILLRTLRGIGDDRLMMVAAGVTFYVLLAIFPAIAAFISIYGLFSDPAIVMRHLEALGDILPGGAVEIMGEQMMRVAQQRTEALGFGLALGLGLALWSANAGMKALFDALNIVYGEQEKRGFVKLTLITLGFTLGAILFLIAALSGVVVLPIVLGFLGMEAAGGWLMLLRWPLLLAIAGGAIAILYRYGPSRRRAKWRWVLWGAALAAIIWIGGSMLFSWYVANFGDYNESYGSLGAAVGFMTWIWLSAVVVLVGAELNAEIEHQTGRDSTVGTPRPLGDRGAVVADTIGRASD